jgi:hypothetical protein
MLKALLNSTTCSSIFVVSFSVVPVNGGLSGAVGFRGSTGATRVGCGGYLGAGCKGILSSFFPIVGEVFFSEAEIS